MPLTDTWARVWYAFDPPEVQGCDSPTHAPHNQHPQARMTRFESMPREYRVDPDNRNRGNPPSPALRFTHVDRRRRDTAAHADLS